MESGCRLAAKRSASHSELLPARELHWLSCRFWFSLPYWLRLSVCNSYMVVDLCFSFLLWRSCVMRLWHIFSTWTFIRCSALFWVELESSEGHASVWDRLGWDKFHGILFDCALLCAAHGWEDQEAERKGGWSHGAAGRHDCKLQGDKEYHTKFHPTLELP